MKLSFPAALILLLCACSSMEEEPPGADEVFEQISRDFLNGYLAFRPVYATRLGVHTFDGALPDYSPRSVDAEILRIDGYLDSLSTIPAGGLSRENLADLELLQAFMFAWRSRLTQKPDFKRDPLFYNEIIVEGLELLLRRDFAPAAERMESLLSRLREIPRFLEVARINLTEVPEVLRGASEKPLVNTMHVMRDALPERIRDQMGGRLPEKFDAAHINAIYAFTDYILFVKDQLVKTTTEDGSLGEDLFLDRWSNEEFVSVSVDAILEVCQSARARVLERMEETARHIDPEADLRTILNRLEDGHETVKGVTDNAALLVDKLKRFTMTRKLLSFPLSTCSELHILEPDPRTNKLITAFPPEIIETTCEAGFVAINPVPAGCEGKEKEENLRFFTPYSIALLTASATVPGSFVQYLKVKEIDSPLRKVLESATYDQGWSHYCEELIIAEGFDPRPEALLTQLKLSLLEINRLEASTRIHCRGMKTGEVVQFLMDNTFLTPYLAERETVEIVRNAKAGSGFVGKAQILKLRDLFLADGSDRTLMEFHNLFLSAGRVPVSVIARTVFGKQI